MAMPTRQQSSAVDVDARRKRLAQLLTGMQNAAQSKPDAEPAPSNTGTATYTREPDLSERPERAGRAAYTKAMEAPTHEAADTRLNALTFQQANRVGTPEARRTAQE